MLGACLATEACRKRTPESAGGPETVVAPAPGGASGAPPAVAKVPPPASAAVLKDVDLTPVREAIAKYQEQFKQKPLGLPDLIRSGLLKQLPAVPPGARIVYDPQKATVSVVPL
ncbi:MAG: hypothetical protein EBS05_14160 [Proteobacteria bacterium]|nr:hypothetical protein [Pseudomonadota bacterium]NDF00528.1 hypothetical protein [Verrucomicrobiota bacterium]